MQYVVKMAIKVKCPTCGRECEYSDKNPYRPFCCERCRLIDLGAWAEGKYSIKDKPMEGDDDLDISADALATGKIAAHKADLEKKNYFLAVTCANTGSVAGKIGCGKSSNVQNRYVCPSRHFSSSGFRRQCRKCKCTVACG